MYRLIRIRVHVRIRVRFSLCGVNLNRKTGGELLSECPSYLSSGLKPARPGKCSSATAAYPLWNILKSDPYDGGAY